MAEQKAKANKAKAEEIEKAEEAQQVEKTQEADVAVTAEPPVETLVQESAEETKAAPSEANETAETDSKNWYVVHAYSGYEEYVMTALTKRIKLEGVEDSFGEMLVPKEQVVEMRRGQKRTSERKYFPGYVLVQMEMNDRTWHLVNSIPKVIGFIGGKSHKPAPISPSEMSEIFDSVRAGVDKPKPKVVYEVGQVIRVTDGPFADFSGVVEEVNYEKNRLRVAVLIFGRSTPVELEFDQVEKG